MIVIIIIIMKYSSIRCKYIEIVPSHYCIRCINCEVFLYIITSLFN